MQIYHFLSALPALLALAGFVLYQVLGANRAGDEISRRIVEKLRTEKSGGIHLDQRLTPKQVERLLEQQQRLRSVVGEHDFLLLRQALKQQFVITILVYSLTVGFCSLSVYLFVQSSQAKAAEGSLTSQTSKGQNSPNVISNGSGPVTVTVQDQNKTASSPKGGNSKK